ncbi:Thiol:disulfide interchange protein TlpA [Planctomycetes bacterium CA13]|uniref:Thiol:disulfide interchange protein TlpA n=1 Tax=Novipirellula herctigrandis TaxID=2527986 RepID=A0A5C5Z4B4_9BACT|nr:Thiol:disulfide interchange protein TlpA [Planctomycetes bacterium CA13]
MKSVVFRSLFVALALGTIATVSPSDVRAEAELEIGTKAPALDIEHWLQDGKGFFKPVNEFEKDNVYVVEFWATWCGPCVMSMPHLAELQNKYRGENVQIVSISDEDPEEIKEFLKNENPEEEKTFDEITSAYSLTTDPDRSSHRDYMEAANQNGIPTSFIVGKSGQIEWIGHPMELEEPLAEVVKGDWDRDAFKKAYQSQQRLQQTMEQISMLAGQGKFEEAIKLIEQEVAVTEDENMKANLSDFRYSLLLSAGKFDDDVVVYYRKQIKRMEGDPMSLAQFGYSLVGVVQQGGKIGPLAKDAVDALAPTVEKADAEVKPLIFSILAQLSQIDEKLDAAVEFQKQAVELSEGNQKKRMQLFLDELTEEQEAE